MFKQFVKGIVVGVATLAIAGTASAADYKINIGGASAQADYWRTAAKPYLESKGCTYVGIAEQNAKNGVVKGTGCTIDASGANDDTLSITYRAIASYLGCTKAPGCGTESMVDPDTCTYTTDWDAPGSCTNTSASRPVHIGASDVNCTSLSQTSSGWEDGYSGAVGGDPWTSYGPYSNPLPGRMVVANPIIVPFGFVVNETVTKSICSDTATGLAADQSARAYDKNGWACGDASDCLHAYKCVGGVCAGGANAGNSCTTADQCPADASEVTCSAQPLENLTRLQAVLIFSDSVDNWQDFGTAYPNLAIVKCMRHAGSGTHATLEKAVFRKQFIGQSMASTTAPMNLWHYRSSTDLLEDCIDRFAGAVGYVDGDKLWNNDTAGNSHQVKYEGAAPTREAIKNCEYSFWAEQSVFYDPQCTDIVNTPILATIADELFAFAGNPAALTEANFGSTANFWAAADEMTCSKGGDDDAFPSN